MNGAEEAGAPLRSTREILPGLADAGLASLAMQTGVFEKLHAAMALGAVAAMAAARWV